MFKVINMMIVSMTITYHLETLTLHYVFIQKVAPRRVNSCT